MVPSTHRSSWLFVLLLQAPLIAACAYPPAPPIRQPRFGATATFQSQPQGAAETLESPRPERLNPPLSKSKRTQYAILRRSIRAARGAGKTILETGLGMMESRAIIRGSCWDWVNAVYKRAGFPNRRGKRKTIFRGSRKKKRFVSINQIRPGDWLYYVNHQYRDVPHSGIFVAWLNKRKKWALIMSYRGARSRTPGGLSEYDLRSVYNIIRPGS